jgi:hypothetical protein
MGIGVEKGVRCRLFRLTRRGIHIFNAFAVFFHVCLFLVVLSSPKDQHYFLKHDRTHVTIGSTLNSAAAAATPPPPPASSLLLSGNMAVMLNSNNQGSFLTTTQMGTTCNFAKPNTLNFTSSNNTVLQTWTYPSDADMKISLKWCACVFFLLSIVFQAIPWVEGLSRYCLSKTISGRLYSAIFNSDESDDVTFDDYLALYKDYDNHILWCSRMLAFNELRFYEYSVSGSLVLLTIAMISGINDVELLMCIYALAFACMIFGLVAEYALRGKVVLDTILRNSELRGNYNTEKGIVDGCTASCLSCGTKEPEVKKDILFAGLGTPILDHVFKVMHGQLHVAFWVSYITAWICIAIPWYIIIMHYDGWWGGGQCKDISPNKSRSTQPPDFLRAVIVLQGMLYASFGFVQLYQYYRPHKRRLAEAMYITLSFTAKGTLGIILAAQVLM